MNPVKVKICGLTRPEDILAVNEARPDYIGFVFASGSKRQISHEKAAKLKQLLSPQIQSAGVFVNQPASEILAIARTGTIDMIQLHGNETAETITEISSQTNLPVIKAIRVRETSDIINVLSFPCDYLLFDTYTKEQYGGSGRQFNWSLILAMTRKFFLAGGLTPDNIAEAAKTGACCLDLSSALETNGKKDRNKIIEIMKIVRSIPICQMENSDSTAVNSYRKL